MTTNNDVSSDEDADFVLKHRITGAAFLIIFGVLFLPWLLSAPSQSSQANAESIDLNSEEASRADIEQELLAAIENESVVEQDLEIYVSRITPLDSQVREAAAQANNATVTEKPIAKPQPLKNVAPEPNVVEKIIPPANEKTNDDVVQKTIQPEPVKQAEPVKTESETPQQAKVDVGWVVQVGVFTDSKGAAKVVADLKNKGFDPSATIVDTNLGKATGTRVWLGPYAQRVDAAKSKTTLKDKTGGDGFIRAYP